MVNEQETLKELKKFCYKSMNKLLWIPIWAVILFPAIMELFGIGKNGYVMSVIFATVILVFLKIRNNWAADEFNTLLKVVKEDGLYEVLLQDFAKNKNNLFYNVMLGNFFIIERIGENIERELRASIRVSSNDKRYQRRGMEQAIFVDPDTAKADYENFCRYVLERNPNVYINY